MNKLQSTAIVLLMLLGMSTGPLFAEHGTLFGAKLDHSIDFPHFGNGDFTRSELVLVNLGSDSHPAIYFYARSGEMIAAESVVEMTENLMVLEDGGLTTLAPIPSLGEITIATNGTGKTVAGSLSVLSSSLMNGFVRYSLYGKEGISVAGVSSSSGTHNFISPVQRKDGGINTGLAVHNLGDEAVNVRCDLMKDGIELASETVELTANGQSAQFITELFSDFFSEPEPEEDPVSENGDDSSSEEGEESTTENGEESTEESESDLFRGSVSCKASSRITSIALEFDNSTNVLTTLPTIPRPSGADFFFSR